MNSDLLILESFIKHHPADVARIVEQQKIEDSAALLQEIPFELAVEFFRHLESYMAVRCLEILDADRAAAIVEKLPLQVVAVFLRQVNEELRETILGLVAEETAIPLRRMLSYPQGSAGALADPQVLTLPDDIAVKEALRRVQKRPENAIYYLYLVNRNQALSGVITLRELLLGHSGEPLSAVMSAEVQWLHADLGFQAIINHPAWQEYHALPVVDDSGMLLGVVRYETLRRIEKESNKGVLPRHALTASASLGELYKIGLSSLVRSVTTPVKDLSEEK